MLGCVYMGPDTFSLVRPRVNVSSGYRKQNGTIYNLCMQIGEALPICILSASKQLSSWLTLPPSISGKDIAHKSNIN